MFFIIEFAKFLLLELDFKLHYIEYKTFMYILENNINTPALYLTFQCVEFIELVELEI